MKQREFIGTIVLFSLLRLIALAAMGLMTQDAYYSYYAENLALSYFDHPPMVAYMIALFFGIFGKSVFVLHMADFLVTSATLGFTYLFLREIVKGDLLKKAFLLLATAPFITVLSINTTPDVPLLFFWSLGLWLGYRAVMRGDWIYWIGFGLASGFAFDSKYTGIFLPFGLLLFMLLSHEHRAKIISWKFISFCLVTLVAISPVAIWNYQNDFISFIYQSSQRAEGITQFEFEPNLFLGYFGSQVALALPLLFLLLYRAAYTVAEVGTFKRLDQGVRFATSFAMPMFLLFTSVALFYWVKINWIMPVYLSGSILAALYIKGWRWLRVQTVFSVVIHVVGIVELIFMPIDIKSDDTWWGWDKLATRVEQISEQRPESFIFSDDSYKTSAALNFYLPQHIYAGNIIDANAFQFALDDSDLQHLSGQDAIYVSSMRRHNGFDAEPMLNHYFERVQPLEMIELKDNNGNVRRSFMVYECFGYRPTKIIEKNELNIVEKS